MLEFVALELRIFSKQPLCLHEVVLIILVGFFTTDCYYIQVDDDDVIRDRRFDDGVGGRGLVTPTDAVIHDSDIGRQAQHALVSTSQRLIFRDLSR